MSTNTTRTGWLATYIISTSTAETSQWSTTEKHGTDVQHAWADHMTCMWRSCDCHMTCTWPSPGVSGRSTYSWPPSAAVLWLALQPPSPAPHPLHRKEDAQEGECSKQTEGHYLDTLCTLSAEETSQSPPLTKAFEVETSWVYTFPVAYFAHLDFRSYVDTTMSLYSIIYKNI